MLATIELIRINDRILNTAAVLRPAEIRSLEAIHLATAQHLGTDFGRVVTYDERMIKAARQLKIRTAAPK